MGRGRSIDAAWLAEHYPSMTDVHELIDEHEREFGWRPLKTSVYMRANRLGIAKRPVANHDGRVERPVRWTREPEMESWMLSHDHGQRTDALSEEFRREFGFGLTRTQIDWFRARHGTQVRPTHKGGKKRVPVGTERASKDGHVVVKVAEEATVPQSKDNWKLKHVHVWEQANGRELPEGHVVMFADRDKSNFDPDNLVAVPRRLAGLLNNGNAPEWHDRETLEACVALAELRSMTFEAQMTTPRTCGVCGREFVPDERMRANGSRRACTCRECLDKGLKASGHRKRYDHEEMRRLAAAGMSQAAIAQQIGCDVSTVYASLKRDRERSARANGISDDRPSPATNGGMSHARA